MKTHVLNVKHPNSTTAGYTRLSQFESAGPISQKISRLIRENFNTVPDPEIGVPSTVIYHADDDGTIASVLCATTIMFELPETVIDSNVPCTYVYYVCTSEKYRRHGLCKKLFETLFKICKTGDIRRVLIDVAVTNTVAQSIYKKLGFTWVGNIRENNALHDVLALDLDSQVI